MRIVSLSGTPTSLQHVPLLKDLISFVSKDVNCIDGGYGDLCGVLGSYETVYLNQITIIRCKPILPVCCIVAAGLAPKVLPKRPPAVLVVVVPNPPNPPKPLAVVVVVPNPPKRD